MHRFLTGCAFVAAMTFNSLATLARADDKKEADASPSTKVTYAEIEIKGHYPEGAQLPGLFGEMTESLDAGIARQVGGTTVGVSVQNVGDGLDILGKPASLPTRVSLGVVSPQIFLGTYLDLVAMGSVSRLTTGGLSAPRSRSSARRHGRSARRCHSRRRRRRNTPQARHSPARVRSSKSPPATAGKGPAPRRTAHAGPTRRHVRRPRERGARGSAGDRTHRGRC
jgi:hypothetical protein